jgi:hypothetical protein
MGRDAAAGGRADSISPGTCRKSPKRKEKGTRSQEKGTRSQEKGTRRKEKGNQGISFRFSFLLVPFS